jgi:hypothetical protein
MTPHAEAACCVIVLPGGAGDHLYTTCPAFRRHSARPGALRCIAPGCDPLDPTVCGWCRRVWKARHRIQEAPPTETAVIRYLRPRVRPAS